MGLKLFTQRYRNEFGGDAGGEGSGGLDISAAVDQIGSDLGFGKDNDDLNPDNPDGDLDDSKSSASPPSPSPSPTPAPSPAPAPAPGPSPAPTPAPSPAPGPTPPRFTKDTPPTTWKPEVAAQWATLPEGVREEIARRESDMFKGLEQYKGEATLAKDFRTALAPAWENLKGAGMHPAQYVQNLSTAHLTLASQSLPMAEKVAFVSRMLQSYGIDLKAVGAPAGAPADDGTTYVDPAVKALQDQVTKLQNDRHAEESAKAEASRAERAREVEAFATDPAHPYFDEVAEDIALLIRGSGGKMPLAEAYEKAVRANPATYAKEAARIQSEAAEKARKEAEAEAERRLKARGGRVRTSGHQGGGTADQGSMEDTMAETLRSIKKRGS